MTESIGFEKLNFEKHCMVQNNHPKLEEDSHHLTIDPLSDLLLIYVSTNDGKQVSTSYKWMI